MQVENNKIRREILKIAQLHSIAENEGRFPACTTACPTGALDFGELPDRIIFYLDFNPVNINTLINAARYETKRD